MGWKASVVIVNKPVQADYELLLRELGFFNLVKSGDEPFESVINPDDNKVYIGAYKNNLLICAAGLPMQFFEDHETETEKALTGKFPGSEICSIVLHSAVNLWGYAVLSNGKKIRVRAGSADSGTFIESGEPLEEEKDLLAMSTMGDDGQRTYIFPDMDDDPMTEDQVGENYVFAICKRYFGEELDQADELLFETVLSGYSFGQAAPLQTGIEEASPGKPARSRNPWWKRSAGPVNLTGHWKGHYTYGKGYPGPFIGRSEPFELDLSDVNGILSGTCIDELVLEKEGNESYIIGTFRQNKIAFKKRYKYYFSMDESGARMPDDQVTPDGVDYTGKLRRRFFSRKIYISGQWSITSTFRDETDRLQTFVCGGTWKMEKAIS